MTGNNFSRAARDVGEWRLLTKDGTYLPVEVSAKILPDGRWLAFVRDISERKRAEEQIRQAQERLDLALKGADLATWDWNIKTEKSSSIRDGPRCAGFGPRRSGLTWTRPSPTYILTTGLLFRRRWTTASRDSALSTSRRSVSPPRMANGSGSSAVARFSAETSGDDPRVWWAPRSTSRRASGREIRQTQERLDLALKGADWAHGTGTSPRET